MINCGHCFSPVPATHVLTSDALTDGVFVQYACMEHLNDTLHSLEDLLPVRIGWLTQEQ